MFRLLLILLGASLLAPASAGAADFRLLDPFQRLCMATDANGDAVIAKARSEGFVSPPPLFNRSLAGAVKAFPSLVALWKVYDGGALVILTGRTALPGNSEVGADVCAVMVTPFEDGAEPALRAFLAVGDGKDSGGVKIFAFKDQDGVRTPVDMDQMITFVKLMEAGRLRLAMPMGSQPEDMSMLMLMVPRAK
jgi:hypothetical protein